MNGYTVHKFDIENKGIVHNRRKASKSDEGSHHRSEKKRQKCYFLTKNDIKNKINRD